MASCKTNKSQAVRDLYAKNPKMPVRLAVETLAGRGIKVAPSQVYFVLGGARQGEARKGQTRGVGRNHKAGNKTGMSNPIELLLDLKAMAERAGGIANLKRLVDVLAE